MEISSLRGLASSVWGMVSSHAPRFRLATKSEILSKLTKLALPAIALSVALAPEKAEAGPLTFAGCMAICLAATWGAFAPACAAACAASIVVPAP